MTGGSAMDDMRRLAPCALLLVIGSSCGEGPTTVSPPSAFEMHLSEPLAPQPAGSARVSAAVGSTSSTVYASLPVGSIPGGESVRIRNVTNGVSVTTDVVDGGFDPIALPASVDDSIEATATLEDGASLLAVSRVPARRPPIVIRTVPPSGGTDVPLNTRIVVVFSEPMDPRTTGAAVRLLRDGLPVVGLAAVSADGMRVHFVPDTPLNPAGNYRLEIGTGATDLSGDSLIAATLVDFHTTTNVNPSVAATVRIVPDTGTLLVGGSLTLRAVVRDLQGNELAGLPVTWSSSAPTVLTLTADPAGPEARALVVGIAAGTSVVQATADGVVGVSTIQVVGGSTGGPTGKVASVTLVPESVTVPMGDSKLLCPIIRNKTGDTLEPVAAWRSADPVVVVVPSAFTNGGAVGCVHVGTGGRGEGTAVVTATAAGISGSATVTIGPPRPVASVEVVGYPDRMTSTTVVLGGGTHLRAIPRDASGIEINPGWYLYRRPVAWQSADPNVATLAAPGSTDLYNGFTAVGVGSTDLTATIEGVTGSVTVRVPLLRFSSLSTADQPVVLSFDAGTNTCGVTPGGEVFCWGDNLYNQMLTPGLWGSSLPLPFGEGRSYSAVSTYGANTCALATTGEAYCAGWGFGPYDSIFAYTQPVRIPGGLRFVSLAVAAYVACGLSASGDVYCWAMEEPNQPQLVTSGLGLVQLSVDAFGASCGLTATGAAYCWGTQQTPVLTQPVPVSGGLTFTTVDVGRFFACGVTTAGDAYCWGTGGSGELGNGTTTDSPVPVPVSGGLKFTAISAGGEDGNQTCGIATTSAAFCWGENGLGQLGDGSTVDRLVPTPVSGGLSFSSISVGGMHTCGITTAGVAYCWGGESLVPVRVPGQP